MRKIEKVTLGQSVSIASRTPTCCLQSKDYDSLNWNPDEQILEVGFQGKHYGITSANISLLTFAPAEESKKK